MRAGDVAADPRGRSPLQQHLYQNGEIRVDPETFDGLIRRVSRTLSRRALVGGSLGAAVLTAVGLSDEVVAKNTKGKAEACIQTGKPCGSPKPRGRKGGGKRGKRPKQLSCTQCCQRRVTTNASGQQVCTCAPNNTPCTENFECCLGACIGNVCGGPRTPAPAPIVTCTASGAEAPGGCLIKSESPTQENAGCCTGTCSNAPAVGNLNDCCTPNGQNPTVSGGAQCIDGTANSPDPNTSCCSGFCTGSQPVNSLCCIPSNGVCDPTNDQCCGNLVCSEAGRCTS